MRSRSSSAIPCPVSVTSRTPSPACRAIRISTRPPRSVASAALPRRFQSTWRSCPGSARTQTGASARTASSMPRSATCCRNRSTVSVTTRAPSRGSNVGERGRAKERNSRTSVSRRSASLRTTFIRRRSCPSSPGEAPRTSMEPHIEARGLRISCARPAAIPPTTAIRSARRTASSIWRSSVRSWNRITWPEAPPASGAVAYPRMRSLPSCARRWTSGRPRSRGLTIEVARSGNRVLSGCPRAARSDRPVKCSAAGFR